MDFFGIGPMEIILILIVALLIFGPEKLPQIGKNLGKTLRSFKKATTDLSAQVSREIEQEKKELSAQVGIELEQAKKELDSDKKQVVQELNKINNETKSEISKTSTGGKPL